MHAETGGAGVVETGSAGVVFAGTSEGAGGAKGVEFVGTGMGGRLDTATELFELFDMLVTSTIQAGNNLCLNLCATLSAKP